ncbi:hypothetical protein MFLO_09782 [Listeria floridensis FSL S10-1187]|uniref:Biofilm-associated protein n=1 Tax=Listeria floridensis FSL S10-1187 TaxID=1265817 RepID=A0ABN0REA5_9LIST|nr:Ig-like domain-containing protein [Listeria floridensis]EUJ30976.1 hypothetical protein MFLO_09782 [Listeria floridensis FSL S10-1187]
MKGRNKRLLGKILKVTAATAIFASTIGGTFAGKSVIPDLESKAAETDALPMGNITPEMAQKFQGSQANAVATYNSATGTLDYRATTSRIARINIGFPRTTTDIQVGKSYRVYYVIDANSSPTYLVQWASLGPSGGVYFDNMTGLIGTPSGFQLNQYTPPKFGGDQIGLDASNNRNYVMKYDVKVNNLIEGINNHGYLWLIPNGSNHPTNWSVRLKSAHVFELDSGGSPILSNPTINEVKYTDTNVTGTAEPGSTVTIYNGSNQAIGTGTANSNGSYSISIPAQPAGSNVSAGYTIQTPDGQTLRSERVSTTVVGPDLPAAPTINPVTDIDTVVTGTAEPGSTVEIRVNGSVIGMGIAGENGDYSISIPRQDAGTELSVLARNVTGASPEAKITVTATPITIPQLDEVTDHDTSVTGTADPGALVTLTINGTNYTGVADGSGNFTILIPRQDAGTVITAKATLNGKTSETTSTTVSDRTAPSAPTINEPITDQQTEVNGTAEPNSTVVIRVGGVEIGQGVTDASGNYRVSIPAQAAGTVLVAYATDAAGNTSPGTSTTVVSSEIPAPTIDQVTDQDTIVKGKTEPNAKVTVQIPQPGGGTWSREGVADANGNYSVTIPQQAAGTEITVVAEKDGKTAQSSTTVVDATAPDAPVIFPVTDEDTIVRGTAEPFSTVKLYADNIQIGEVQAGSDGSYQFTIPKQSSGTMLSATATDGAGNTSPRGFQEVTGVPVPTPNINPVNNEDTVITGTSVPNATIELRIPQAGGGTLILSGTADANGNWSIQAPAQPAGTVITATATLNGKTSEAATEIVTEAPQKDYSLTVNEDPYIVGTTGALTGTFGADISRVRLFVNGTVVTQATTDQNGNYTFPNAAQFITSADDTIEVVGVDSSYIERNRIPVNVQANFDYALNPDEYHLGDATLTGTHGDDVFRVRLFINGTVVAQAEQDGQGNFVFRNMLQYNLKPTDVVEVVGVDSRYIERNRVTIPLQGSFDYSLSADRYELGDNQLTGIHGSDIFQVRLFINGEVKAQAQKDGQGNFTFPSMNQYGLQPTDTVELVGVDSQFREQNRISVPLEGSWDYSLTANPYVLGEESFGGTYGDDINRVRLLVNGTIVKEAELGQDGSYTFNNLAQYNILPTDMVEVVGIDSQFVERARVQVELSAPKDYSLTADPYTLDGDNLTGTSGTDIAYVRLFVNGEVKKQATPSNGQYSFGAAWELVQEGDTVEVVGVDSSFAERARVQVNVQGTLDYSLTANDFTIGDNTITGTKGENISFVRLFVNGVVKRQASITGGTFSVYAADILPTDKVEIVGVDRHYVERARVTVQE